MHLSRGALATGAGNRQDPVRRDRLSGTQSRKTEFLGRGAILA
jgi:hypothetical protein